MHRNLLVPALLVALAACTPRQDASISPPLADQPTEDIPPATMPVPASMAVPSSTEAPAAASGDGDLQAGFAGYGDVKFGIAAANMEHAWGGALRTLGKDANPQCYFMVPMWAKTPAEFAFMIGDGKFARYGTDSPEYAAPGGGKVGMAARELQALYRDALQSTPHKYIEGGQYLTIVASGASPAKLVFEVDAAGKATQWRVGVPPEVDYLEGCS